MQIREMWVFKGANKLTRTKWLLCIWPSGEWKQCEEQAKRFGHLTHTRKRPGKNSVVRGGRIPKWHASLGGPRRMFMFEKYKHMSTQHSGKSTCKERNNINFMVS